MDVRDAPTAHEHAKSPKRSRGARVAGLVLFVALVAVYSGHSKDMLVVATVASAASGLWFVELARLRRVADRRVRTLEQRAPGLGLTPSVSNARIYEGDGEQGHVRVWVEDPPMLDDTVGVFTVACWALFTFGPTMLGLIAVAGVLTGAVLLSVWTSRHAQINVEWVSETGLLHQVEVHRSGDVNAALDRQGLEGALGFSDDNPRGRIGIAGESGALSSSDRED